jgi:CBS domain-containing protein
MTSVKTCLALKPQPVTLVSVGPNDKVVDALRLMQDKRVRAILVLEGDQLLGIVTQGDCAIKVLLPGLDCKEVAVKDVMTAQPVTVKLDDPMEACTGLMAARNFRHLPVLEQGKVVGVVSVGDVIKQNIREMEQQIGFLETYIKGHGG